MLNLNVDLYNTKIFLSRNAVDLKMLRVNRNLWGWF